MPKSIVDVDVNYGPFKEFQALFQKHQDMLAKMPAEWKDVSDAIRDVTETLSQHVESGGADAFTEGAVAAGAVAEAMESASIATAATGRGFADISRHSKSIAHSLFSATADLTKWAALSAGAGLLGGGGLLWGMDRLADTVSGQRRAAQGLGVTTGEQQAFGTTLGRLVDPSMMQNVSDVRADLSQQWKLGLTQSQIGGDDNAQLSVDELTRARNLWKQLGPAGQNTQMFQAYGLDSMMSYDDWRRIGNTSNAEFGSDIKQFQATSGALNTPDATQKSWQDFSVQLQTAGQQIERVFITGLVPLLGPLTGLSQAVVKDLTALLGNPAIKTGINDFAHWIGSFAGYLGSPKFAADMATFGGDISAVASGLENALHWLGLIPTPVIPTSAATLSMIDHQGSSVEYPRSSYPDMGSVAYSGFDPLAALTTPGISHGYDFRKVAKFYGLPPQLFTNLAGQESGFDPKAVSPAGAQGMFQFMPATQTQYGITDPTDPMQEAQATGAKMNDLLTEYNGSLSKALAAWNWGDGNLDKDIAAHGDNWLKYAPKETQGFVKNVSRGITVNVTNQTGANVAILANATAQ